MEKKTFITLVLGVVGGLLFSLGMCMALVTEWAMFHEGVVVGAIGAVVLLITLLVHRKMSGKAPVKLNLKTIAKVIYGIFATLVFGAGMCMVLVMEGMMLQGIAVGIVGIVLLLCLVPMCIGFKDSKKITEEEA